MDPRQKNPGTILVRVRDRLAGVPGSVEQGGEVSDGVRVSGVHGDGMPGNVVGGLGWVNWDTKAGGVLLEYAERGHHVRAGITAGRCLPSARALGLSTDLRGRC